MKRWFFVVLLVMICMALLGCNRQVDATPSPVPPAVETPPTEIPAPPVETPPAQAPVTPPEEPLPAEPLPGEPEVPEVAWDGGIVITHNANNDTVFQLDVTLPSCDSLPKIDSYYQTMFDDLKATYDLLHEDATRQQAEYQAMGQEFTPWQVKINAEITRNDGVTLSVMREIYEQLGGDPSITYQCETFDVATQGRLLLGNLFQPGTDYQSYWTETGELEQLNFAITHDAVVVCGENGGTVPLSDLSHILLPQYITE